METVMNSIHSITEIQEAIKAGLTDNVFFARHNVPILVENSKMIDYEIKSAMSATGIAATVTTPTVTYRGEYAGENGKDPYWEISSFNVVIVENPTLNRGKATYATALDTALQVAYSLHPIPGLLVDRIVQTAQGGLVVVTVACKSNIAFMLERVPAEA